MYLDKIDSSKVTLGKARLQLGYRSFIEIRKVCYIHNKNDLNIIKREASD